MATKKKAQKRPPREDFNEAAFRIVRQATKEKGSAGVVNTAVKATPVQAARLTEYRFTAKDMLRLDLWDGDEMLQVAS